jgi:hypothetical protein
MSPLVRAAVQVSAAGSHPIRGRQTIEVMGVLRSFAGIAIHYAWAL